MATRAATELRFKLVGWDIMQPSAAPIIGGMVTSMIRVLAMTPVIFVPRWHDAARRYLAALRACGETGGIENVRSNNCSIARQAAPWCFCG